VASIVRAARVKNALASITGLLAFDGLHFCHYLEGPRDAVGNLADKIAGDDRHIRFEIHEVRTMATARRFEGTSMGYALVQCERAIPAIARPGAGSPIERLELLLPSLIIVL